MMKSTFIQLDSAYPRISHLAQVFLGSVFMALLAQLAIPLKPIPMSMQTLGVFLLPLCLGKNRAALALMLYLAEATLGLPVLAGYKMNPFWLMGPTAGYLISFPIAAYVVGLIVEKAPSASVFWMALAILAGQVVIYTFGLSFLACAIGFHQAIAVGLVPFIPVNFYKLGIALATSRFIQKGL